MNRLFPAIALAALCAGGPAFNLSSEPSVLADNLGLEAVVQPYRILNLGAARDGLIRSVQFDRGDRVRAGDVVAKLDTRAAQAQADLAEARAARNSAELMVSARLADARRRLSAQEALYKDGVVTAETLGTIRTEVHLEELAAAQQTEERIIAELEHRRVLAGLAEATIASPIDGIVTDRVLSPGEYYSRSGQASVLTIAQLDPLVVEVNVPIEYFEQIAIGDTGQVRLDAPGNPLRQAIVKTKDKVVDTASRTFRVRMHLDNPDYELPAGLRCTVEFIQ